MVLVFELKRSEKLDWPARNFIKHARNSYFVMGFTLSLNLFGHTEDAESVFTFGSLISLLRLAFFLFTRMLKT